MNELYLIKSGDNGFVEETSAVISADSGEISINDSLYVESAGNIGIGSSSPVNKLDVVGSANISSDLTVQGITFTNVGGNSPSEANDIIKYDGNNWVVAASTTLPGGGGGAGNSAVPAGLISNLTQGETIHEIDFGYDTGNARIVYDNVPKIAASLEIDGAGEIIPHTVSGVSESGYFVVFSEELPTANYRMHTVFGGTDAFWETGVANLEYSDRNVEVTRSLYVGQKVGIGNTNPGASLQIESASDDQLKLTYPSIASYIQTVNSAGDFSISRDANERLRIDSAGNVGIGTTNPDRPLVIGAGVNSSPVRLIARSTDEVCAIQIRNSANTATVTQLGGNIDSYFTGGNVGIGTTNPGANLEIKGGSEPLAIYDANDEKKLRVYTAVNGTVLALTDGGEDIIRLDGRTSSPNSSYFNAGNVGIGTTNPIAALNIAGVAADTNAFTISRVEDGATPLLRIFQDSNWNINGSGQQGSGIAHINTNNRNLAITTSTSASLSGGIFINETGKVGIGTTNPIGPLHVSSGSANTISLTREVDISNVAGGAACKIEGGALSGTNPSMGAAIGLVLLDSDASGAGTNTEGYLYFETKNSGAGLTEKMRITSTGNVGIGTTNPGAGAGGNSSINPISNVGGKLLHVENNSGNTTLVLGSSAQPSIMFAEGDASANEGYKIFRISGGKSQFVNLNDNGTEKNIPLSIGADGNVGIGTVSPDVDLHVRNNEGHGQSTLKLQGNNTGGFCSAIIFTNSDQTSNGAILYNADDNYIRFNTGGLGQTTERLRITAGGNVGIGTTNPSGKLHVNGIIYGTTTAIFGNLSVSSDVQTNANKELISTSDKRLKNDLGDCEYGLNEVLQVQPKKYTWKEGPEDQKPTVGFFAQDVHAIMPEAAPREAIQNENGEDDYRWGFHSQTIIAALVNATKEQQTMIEDLKKEIEQLKS